MVRFKNRWLLVEFLPIPSGTSSTSAAGLHQIEGKHVWSALKESVLSHFGDVGWGAVGLSLNVKYYSPTTHICIIRVAREHHKIAWGAATMLRSIEGIGCLPHVVHVSGTIKHVQLAAIEHNRVVVARYRARANVPSATKDSYEDYLETSRNEIEGLRD
ncbi:RNA-binding protein pop5 [Stygiomarasmius scandens]|uniref:RNA-binding protein pop5 n=1 Tax=Marasmiellus scandens TaxID=2682957 RepID=A0ABR1JJV5_9AGAR